MKLDRAALVSRNNERHPAAPEPGSASSATSRFQPGLTRISKSTFGKLLRRSTAQTGPWLDDAAHDSWEMGAQNWSPKLREEFKKRRGYDPQPFYPVYLGHVVGSRAQSERFLWDLRLTGQELVIENHAEHLKRLGRQHGFRLSIEPYDMNPANDFDLERWRMCHVRVLEQRLRNQLQLQPGCVHVRTLWAACRAVRKLSRRTQEACDAIPFSLKNQGDWRSALESIVDLPHIRAQADETRPGWSWDLMASIGTAGRPVAAGWRVSPILSPLPHLPDRTTVADGFTSCRGSAQRISAACLRLCRDPITCLTGALQIRRCSAQALLTLAEAREGRIVYPRRCLSTLVLPTSRR